MRKRDKVRVEGKEYTSLAKAFVALGLPLSRHQHFRRRLKALRKADFDGYEFEIVE